MGKMLPKNWVETELGNILKLKNGYAFKTKDYREEGIPLIRIGNIQQGDVSTKKSVYVDENELAKDFVVEKGDVLVAMSGATTGKYGVFKEDIIAYQNQRVGNLKPLVPELTSKQFIYYLLGDLKKEIEDKAYGGAQPNISSKLIETLKFPLPPLKEQQRIVAKLDTLFTHLENLKTRLHNIPTLLKHFRQAILTQAVIGKLTEAWREDKEKNKSIIKEEINNDYFQYDLPKSWVNTVIQNIGSVKGGKRLPKGEKLLVEDTGYPYIRARDLKKGTVLVENLMYLSESVQEKIKRYIVATDDVYITIVGAKIGDAGIIPKEMNGANLTENAAKVTDFVEELNAKYFSLFLRSSVCQASIQKAIMSAAQGKLALSRIKNLPIYLPPKEEQTEIVKRVENLFAKADQIEVQYQQLKDKIDSLPQAILAKAFKGELVPQLPTDGDAKDLLAEIQQLKKALKPTKKTVVRENKNVK